MKAINFLGTLLLAGAILISCNFDDNDSHAETTQTFTGFIDSLTFTNQADTTFESLIKDAMVKDSLAGKSFSHSVSMNGATPSYVTIVCNAQGVEHYKSIIKRHNIASVRKYIYSIDSIKHMYASEADIPLHEYKAYVSLFTTNGFSPISVYKDTITIR